MRIVAALDTFRGSIGAAEAVQAVGVGIARARPAATLVGVPVSDGGEGFLDVLGGANRSSLVTGPLGDPVRAPWRLARRTAVIEMARASGLELIGGAEANDPISATTNGTGELILTAVESGATRVLVGVGGSATTDGGWGAVQALHPVARLAGVELVVACDVRTAFTEAATVFGPQKGASPAQVRFLTRRLERLVQVYDESYGVDVSAAEGAGAAGGLAGGLLALGARLESGVDLVVDETELDDKIEGADLLITGEGRLDASSLDGKVVGGLLELAGEAEVPVLVVAGAVEPGLVLDVEVISLVETFGAEASMGDTARCLAAAVERFLA